MQHTHNFDGSTEQTLQKKNIDLGGYGGVDDGHRHDFHGTTNYASAYLHHHGLTIATDGSHTHGATSSDTALTTDSTSHLPSYVALHYIIRLK